MTEGNRPRVQATLQRRRSNASGIHIDRRTRRRRTRASARTAAIRDT